MRTDESGIWEGFIEGVNPGLTYKYHVVSQLNGVVHDKSDPFGFYAEEPPKSASRIWDMERNNFV